MPHSQNYIFNIFYKWPETFDSNPSLNIATHVPSPRKGVFPLLSFPSLLRQSLDDVTEASFDPVNSLLLPLPSNDCNYSHCSNISIRIKRYGKCRLAAVSNADLGWPLPSQILWYSLTVSPQLCMLEPNAQITLNRMEGIRIS